MTSSIIELQEVNKTYSTAAGDFVALKDVNLKVNAGRVSWNCWKIRRGQIHFAKHDQWRGSTYQRRSVRATLTGKIYLCMK